MTPEFLETLPAGTRAVMHSSNGGEPVHLFRWFLGHTDPGFTLRVYTHLHAPHAEQ